MTNTTLPSNLYGIAVGTSSTNPFVDEFLPRDPTANDINYPVQKKWLNTVDGHFWELEGFSSLGGIVQANWLKIGSIHHVETLTGNLGGPVGPTANNINVVGDITTIETIGNPATSTLTITVGDEVPLIFLEDTGSATATVNVIHVLGGPGITTSGATNVITIDTSGSVATSYVEDVGTAIPALGVLNVIGGTGITTTGAGNTITIDSSNIFNYTDVTFAMSPYTVIASDYYISVDSSAGAVVLDFPNAPAFKREWIVKDRTGTAAGNNISLTTPGGIVTFDGLATYIINSNYQSVELLANATPTYEVF